MAKTMVAVLLLVLIGFVSCQTISSEAHIKQLIQSALNKCSSCHDAGQKVLDRNTKDDICDAVNVYALCSPIPCIGNSVSTYVDDAKDICDGAVVYQVSLLALLVACVAKYVF